MNNYDVSSADYYILPGRENNDLFQLPLPSKIVNNEILKKKYLNEIARINQYMSIDSLEKFILQMHKLIAPSLKGDSGKVMTMVQYEKSLLNHVAISEFDFEGLLSFIRRRHEQIAKMLKAVDEIYKD